MKTLSIIIAVYNEEKTLATLIKSVEAVDLGKTFKKEIIIVDDASTDTSRSILKNCEEKYKVFYHDQNRGKGAALRTGFTNATGDFAIIQDADLEYHPKEYTKLLQPLIDGRAQVVYGSRFMGSEPKRVLYYWHYLGNKIITTLSNMLTNLNLSDIETCYKAFTKEALQKIAPNLISERFGIEPEITARVAKHGLPVYEIGISYNGRTYAEGKKISWKDGLAAIWHILRFNLWD